MNFIIYTCHRDFCHLMQVLSELLLTLPSYGSDMWTSTLPHLTISETSSCEHLFHWELKVSLIYTQGSDGCWSETQQMEEKLLALNPNYLSFWRGFSIHFQLLLLSINMSLAVRSLSMWVLCSLIVLAFSVLLSSQVRNDKELGTQRNASQITFQYFWKSWSR